MPSDIVGSPTPSEKDKDMTLVRLAIRLSNFTAGLAGLVLLHTDAINTLEEQSIYLQGDNIWSDPKALDKRLPYERTNFKDLVMTARSAREDVSFSFIARELARSLRRSFVTESVEIIISFTKEHNLWSNLNSHPWFHYARFVRNAMSHDYRFCFSKKDREYLPVTWNGFTIDRSIKGHDLNASFMTPEATIELHRHMIAWVMSC
jgi:hypothetical protein